MSEELWSSAQVIKYLEVNLNNLRQMQFRGAIKWKKKVGKEVFYLVEDVKAYKAKREARKQE